MADFVYVGSGGSTVGASACDQFGARVTMELEAAEEAARGGFAIVPAKGYDALGITPAEIKDWGMPWIREHEVPADDAEAAAKESFLRKRMAAHALHADFRRTATANCAERAAKKVAPKSVKGGKQ